MRVLGIDPGLGRCGFAVLEVKGRSTKAISYGTVATGAGPVPMRLAELAARLRTVIREFHPDVGAIEQLFVNRNTRTAMTVGQASGVALLVAAEAGLPVSSYTPSQVKLAVTGTGSAPKAQIGFMVKAILGLPALARPADSADAIAVALCHIQHSDLADTVGATVSRTGTSTPPEPAAPRTRPARRRRPGRTRGRRAGRHHPPAQGPRPDRPRPGRCRPGRRSAHGRRHPAAGRRAAPGQAGPTAQAARARPGRPGSGPGSRAGSGPGCVPGCVPSLRGEGPAGAPTPCGPAARGS